MKTLPISRRRGFAMMELLIVLTIGALLFMSGFVAGMVIQKKKMEAKYPEIIQKE